MQATINDKSRWMCVDSGADGRKGMLLVDIGTLSSALFDKAAEELKIRTYEIPGSVTVLLLTWRIASGASNATLTFTAKRPTTAIEKIRIRVTGKCIVSTASVDLWN